MSKNIRIILERTVNIISDSLKINEHNFYKGKNLEIYKNPETIYTIYQ